MSTQEVAAKIESWAKDRNLVQGSTVQAQLNKLVEEIGELAKGINKHSHIKVLDGIGDAAVVLVIMAAQMGVTLEDCMELAYNEIKDRKGKMINGIFVKESDLT